MGLALRYEFPKSVRSAALERSGGQCEARGARYGLPDGVRCQTKIGPGNFEADHFPRPAHDPHPDTKTLINCVAVCKNCNRWANNKIDTPREAKIKRVQRRELEHAAAMAEKAGQSVDLPPPRRKHPPKKIQSQGFPKMKRPLKSKSSFQKGHR